MHMMKRENNLKTIDEIMTDISNESRKKKEEELEAELKEKYDLAGELDPEARASKLKKKAKMFEDIEEIQNRAIA